MNLQTFQQFLSGDDKLLAIPSYQRDYAWEIQNIEDLFNDIQEAIETETSHYIGTFILSKGDNAKSYMIVDGQQRLTTLYMLLGLLVSGLADQRKRDAYNYAFVQNSDGIKKLELVGSNSQFFDALLSGSRPTPKVKSQRLLALAFNHMKEHVNLLNQSQLIQWVDTIRRFEIIEFIESDEGKAIRMFQSVNDRGVPLSNMDKAKSLLIYYSNRFLSGQLDARINEKFGECFRAYDAIKEMAGQDGFKIDLLDRKTFSEDDIFRYHYLTYNPTIDGVNSGFDFKANMNYVLSSYLKPTLKSLRGNHVLLEKFISIYIDDLANFYSSFMSLVRKVKENYRLYHFLVLQNASAFIYPLMIRLHQRGLLLSGGFNFLKKLFVADMRVYKIRGTGPARDIYMIAHESYGAEPSVISNKLLWFVRWFMNDSLLRSSIQNQKIYGNSGLYSIFTMVEIGILKKDVPYKDDKDQLFERMVEMAKQGQTIEHILPQEPAFSVNAYDFKDDEEYFEFNDKIGNLTLLTESENKSYSNKSPNEKISNVKLYQSSFYMATRMLAGELSLNAKKFNKSEIEARSEDLAQFCIEKWPLWEQLP
jgi:uncharacterized protein with ParB-like and HNH nuclease domain